MEISLTNVCSFSELESSNESCDAMNWVDKLAGAVSPTEHPTVVLVSFS